MLCDMYEVVLGSSPGGISNLIVRIFVVRQVATLAELHPRVQVYLVASHSASPTCCASNTSSYKFFDSFLSLIIRIETVFANEVLSQKI